MQIHLINLKKRKDRLEQSKNELSRQKITDYTIWEAEEFAPVHEAIAASHKKIVQYAKDRNLPEVLILEDDVRFPAEDGFEYFIKNKPADFDLYLAGIYDGTIKNGMVERFCGLHCYIVNSRFYDTFLSANTSTWKHIDNALSFKGIYYVCYPFAAIQYDGFSDNVKQQTHYTNMLVGREIYGLV